MRTSSLEMSGGRWVVMRTSSMATGSSCGVSVVAITVANAVGTEEVTLPVALFAVATSRELAVTGVARLDALGCTAHAPPSKPSRFRFVPEH